MPQVGQAGPGPSRDLQSCPEGRRASSSPAADLPGSARPRGPRPHACSSARGGPETSPQGAGRAAVRAGAVGAPGPGGGEPRPAQASLPADPPRPGGLRRRGNDVIALGATSERDKSPAGAKGLRCLSGGRAAATAVGGPAARGRERLKAAGGDRALTRPVLPREPEPAAARRAAATCRGAVDRTWRKVRARTGRPLRSACGPPGEPALGLPEEPKVRWLQGCRLRWTARSGFPGRPSSSSDAV